MSPSLSGRGSPAPRPTLSERNRCLLASLVREYIERGEPVSSLWLAEHSGLALSSATVRNALAALEELGYVRQPHTSAGRVPTDQAYRCYVDQLLEARRPARPAAGVEARLRQAGSVEDVLDSVSQELSRSSHHLGFALALANRTTLLRHIDFVSLDATRVLVVIVATNGQVWHKPVTLDEPLKPSDLTQAANVINQHFGGHPIGAIRDELAVRIQQDRVLYDRLLARVLEVASDSLATAASAEHLFVHGASSLIDTAHDDETRASMAGLRGLLRMIEEKHRLFQLLTEYIDGPGLTVVIGGEHISPDLKDFSLVVSAHGAAADGTAVGVIGPTRMRYSRAITAVESVSHVLGRVLTNPSHPGA
jgi:heat-inducible transcriptional repressor